MKHGSSGRDRSKPSRRWYQFSLKTLLVGVLLAGVTLGVLGRRVRELLDQRKAAAELLRLGGQVRYGEARGLRRLLGDDFRPVVSVGLAGRKLAAADWKHLRHLTSIEELTLGYTDVSDAELVCLNRMSNLRHLDLRVTSITDAGLEHIRGLTRLEWLSLKETMITDAGLEHLKALANLKVLVLTTTDVSDRGLRHFKGLSSLTGLYLRETGVTREGVEDLKDALPNCGIVQVPFRAQNRPVMGVRE